MKREEKKRGTKREGEQYNITEQLEVKDWIQDKDKESEESVHEVDCESTGGRRRRRGRRHNNKQVRKEEQPESRNLLFSSSSSLPWFSPRFFSHTHFISLLSFSFPAVAYGEREKHHPRHQEKERKRRTSKETSKAVKWSKWCKRLHIQLLSLLSISLRHHHHHHHHHHNLLFDRNESNARKQSVLSLVVGTTSTLRIARITKLVIVLKATLLTEKKSFKFTSKFDSDSVTNACLDWTGVKLSTWLCMKKEDWCELLLNSCVNQASCVKHECLTRSE